ncbi:MAG: hypothetical protein JSS05_13625 [Proteobacteria bacterium]|nr:hypothetical protein [Pseudomonadota bacterium]
MSHATLPIRVACTLSTLSALLFACLAPSAFAQAAGALDTSFDGDGRVDRKVIAGNVDQAMLPLAYPGRRIVVIGRCTNNSNQPIGCVTRFNEDGSPDSSFGTGGVVIAQWFSQQQFQGAAGAVQPDGKLLIVGTCTPIAGGSSLPCHARLLANGQPDISYGGGTGGGVVLGVVPNNVNSSGVGVAMQGDGKIVVGGQCVDTSSYGYCAWRYSSTGFPDTTYGNAGMARYVTGGGTVNAKTFALQPDNAAIVGGACGDSNACLVRFNASGMRDTAYVGGGGAPTLPRASGTSTGEYVNTIALQPDGSAVIGGLCVLGSNPSALRACAARVTPGGALDASFASGWVLPTHAALGNSSEITGITVQRDGKIVTAVACGDHWHVCALRSNSDGSLDQGYGSGGVMTVTVGGYATQLAGAMLDADERLVLGGGCYGNDGGGISDTCLWRLQRGAAYAGRSCTLDVDDDGVALGVNDLVLMTRAALGFSGNGVIAGLPPSATARRTTWPAIRDYLVNQCGLTGLSP